MANLTHTSRFRKVTRLSLLDCLRKERGLSNQSRFGHLAMVYLGMSSHPNHGGQCVICHYNKCLSALEFHHIERHTKEGMVSRLAISGGSYEQAKREADKCVLLCANCHREVHDGVATLVR